MKTAEAITTSNHLAVPAYLDRQQCQQRQDLRSQLENEITELMGHIHAANYRLLRLVQQFDACEGWGGEGIKSCAHWLNWKCGISLGAAREKVRVAHALVDLPQISASFSAGQLSYSKVRAMTRVATPQNENYLLMIARHGTATHVERHVRNFRLVKRIEAAEREDQRHINRELNMFYDHDGSCVLRGRFTPEQGALLEKVLAQIMEDMATDEQDVPAGTCSPAEADEIHARPEPIACRRADALGRMALCYQASSSKACNSADRFVVHVHTSMNTLRANGTGAESELEDSGVVCAETTRRLACDAGVVQWCETASGQPLSVGRKTRSIPPAIRRALRKRDGGCRFPGCTCSRFVDAHHIHHWADGGETSLNNLVMLCRQHHRLVHEGGFGLCMDAAGDVRFSHPDGHIIATCGESRSRGNVFELLEQHRKAGLEITPETAQSQWLGEEMDYHLAIDVMLQLERKRKRNH